MLEYFSSLGKIGGHFAANFGQKLLRAFDCIKLFQDRSYLIREIVVNYDHLFADKRKHGLFLVVFEVYYGVEGFQVEAVSLTILRTTVKNISNSKDYSEHFKEVLILRNNVIQL